MKIGVENDPLASSFRRTVGHPRPFPTMPPPPFTQRSAWIWSAEGSHAAPPPEAASPSAYQVRMFRREFIVGSGPRPALVVHVSADSRYVFFLNGERVGRGPAKGDVRHHFYDTFDLGARLHRGPNVLAALVLDLSRVAHRPTHLGPPCSVMTYTGGFLLEGALRQGQEEIERLDTGAPGWRVAVDRAHRFQNEGTRFEGYLGYFEHRLGGEIPAGWTRTGFDATSWAPATVLYPAERIENRRDPASPYGLMPRMIPLMEEQAAARFADAFLPGGAAPEPGWQVMLRGEGPVTVPPATRCRLIVDAGEMTTAFPLLVTAGGQGSRIRLTYAEALRLPWDTPGARLLGHPQPLANLASHFADESSGWTFDRRGTLHGWSDLWEPAGAGDESFEPLHWRAFRFVALDVTTADAPLTVQAFTYQVCLYPAPVAASFATSDPRLERIWEVGLRTMRLCAHETFDDCPHYEQMQYAGDTMITSKLLMLTTGDYRLTRQALYHFDWSRLPDGLTQSRYPSRLLQVIPSWSLHWITAVRDYLYCSGDGATVADVLPGTLAVLDWFRRHADADGLPAKLPFWNITDWCPWWPRGVVPGADSGPTCIISAQYIQALAEVADLARRLGHARRADELEAEASGLRAVLRARFWSPAEGLFFDRPGGPEVSQYGNAWAIACDAATPADCARLLERFPQDPKLAPGSYFCWHTVFLALAKAGAYDRMPEFLGPWHEMVDHGLTTFVEENSYWRSLCHAWSAHPVIEFLEGVVGIRATEPGFAAVEIRPHRCGLTRAAGRVCTPRGPVSAHWRWEASAFALEIEAPAGTPVSVVFPHGVRRTFSDGRFAETVVIP